MEYALIAALLLFIILPIIAILPSPRERQKMRMRLQARAAGVTVRLASLEAGGPGARPLQLMAYMVQRPAGSSGADWQLRKSPGAESFAAGVAESFAAGFGAGAAESAAPGCQEGAAALPGALSRPLRAFLATAAAKLPADVELAQEQRGAIAIYWHERTPGSERQVIDFLLQCRRIGA